MRSSPLQGEPRRPKRACVTSSPPKIPTSTFVRRTCETLALGIAGGVSVGLTGFPAGWLSGAILVVSIAAIAGRPMVVPNHVARVTYVVMGISLGGTVTPETVAGMVNWPMSIFLLSIAMALLTVAVTLYLRIVHKWDSSSALLGSFPGGLATVMVLAIEHGANVRAVAVVQTVRVVAIALLLPAGLALLGLTGEPLFPAHRSPFSAPGELALLVVVSTTAAIAAQLLHFPGGLIFGAMVSSAILHGAGWVTVNLPQWLTLTSFMILGTITGTRFAGMDIRTLRHLAAAAFGALIVGIGVAFACAVAAAWLLSLDAGPMTIAYAPGAIDAMMVLALALNYDAAFVGAHHLSRFVLVLAAMPLVVHIMQRMSSKPQPKDTPPDSG
jgi:uncharacterized protein